MNSEKLEAMIMKMIADILEEEKVFVGTHFLNEFSKTKSSTVLNKVEENRDANDMSILRKTWRTLNCTQKTLKVIRENHENLLCVGKKREMITKKRSELKCW